MSRDVITVGSIMRIPLLYRGEYSQWRERFMNYLEEQTDGEAMINFIQNDPKFWTAEEKKTRKIDRLARSLLIQWLLNDIYSLIDSNETVKDLWDALKRQMHGSEYGEQDRKAAILYEYETSKLIKESKWKQYGILMRQTKNLMDINIDALYNILKQNQGDVNDALGYKKKAVVITLEPLALKTKVSKRKEKVVVSSDSEGSGADDISELKKITTLLAKAFNRMKFYSKPTNNNLRTSSTSQSANKKQEFVKSDEKKEDKKADEKKRDMSKVKCYNCKKEGHFAKDYKKAKIKYYNYYKTKMLLAKKDSDEQVLLAEDQAWMESSSDSDQEINANIVFMAQIEKVLSESNESSSFAEETIAEVAYYTSESESEYEFKTSEYYDNSTNYGLYVNNDDDQENFHDAIESASENFIENHIDSQKDYDKSEVDHNDSEEKEHFEQNNEFSEQIKVFNEKNADLLDQTRVLKDQFQVKHVVIDTHVECHKKYAKLEEERYEYMIRYSALCDNDKQHRKKIDEQEILFDKMSRQLVEMNNNVLRLQEKIIEKETKILELEGCASNKDVKIEKCLERLNECENKLHKIGQKNQTIHMIMPSKYTLYNGRKGIGFENPSYFEKVKDLRPTLYDEKVIGLGYTPMFLIHSNEALEIEKFKRSRENKIKFTYDYENLNASYVNEKINFKDDYFQEIINPYFKKIDSLFQQTSSLKPYVPNVILEKIIIDLEDEVVSLLEKEKENLKTIESLKSKGFESLENAISKSKNQSDNDCHVVEEECDKVENSKVIAPGMFKLNVSQCVSPISMMYDLLDDNNFFIFDDESVRISSVSKMPFRKKPRDSMNVRSKSNMNKSLPRTVHKWLPKMQPLAEPIAKWIPRIVQICLWIIDLGCSNHMTGNRALLTNFVEKFLGTVRFGNNYFMVIAGYGDVGLEVAFRKSTCFVRNEDGVDLLTGDHSSNLYTIALNEVASNSSTYEASEAIISFIKKTQVNLQLQVQRFRTDNGTEFKNKTLAKFLDEVVEAARTMLTFANLPSFLWAEAIATACFTQNRSIIHKRFDKTPYELMSTRKPNIKFFRVFGCRCYLLNDYEDVGKLKEKGDIEVIIGYSKESAAFIIYNKRTRKIHESVNVNFDEISEMASKQFSLEPGLSNLNKTGKSSNPSVSQVLETSKKDLEDLFHNFYDEYFDSSKIMRSSTTNVET
uniref:Uncharacterized protein n=1 Tax=Tanacetum cinerariifolium TaxID=118510 RepID=A0A6L2KW72_TANCI|nr:hypothetical protein [Tanacetum cinerariifolium]